jgi:soluble lytic murein transglycosylase-like protein
MPYRRRHLAIAAIVLAIAGLAVVIPLMLQRDRTREERRQATAANIEAPADLASVRPQFLEALQALHEADGARAVRLLDQFTFGSRAVEQYRLYYLATALQLSGQHLRARRVFAELWTQTPTLAYWHDVGFTLAGLYRDSGDWNGAAEVYEELAARAESTAVAANARSEAMRMRFYAGDPGAMALVARNMIVASGRAPQAADAVAALRLLTATPPAQPLPLRPSERLERAKNLLRDGHHQVALDELSALQPWNETARTEIALNRGIALHHLRKYEESNRLLEPLASSSYAHAIPAIRHAARNYRALASSINPETTRTVREKKKVGTKKVKKGKKTVTQPVYKTVTRSVKVVDAERTRKKEAYERLRVERLRDLLQLPADPPVRKETLLTLIGLAMEKNQDDYIRQLITELVKIEPRNDEALQRFWDKAWSAYLRGDHATAQELLQWIEQTYLNPNVKRQARYWRARSYDKSGRSKEAAELYQSLVDAPYQDLYAKFAATRGARKSPDFEAKRESRPWQEIADTDMPRELQLAWELNALGMARDARLEVQRNVRDENRPYAEAILADLLFNSGSRFAAFEYMRRAWPQLATVEQDQVPQHFIDLYYPLEYESAIRENAQKRNLDPYLVMGLIRQESGFDPTARSRVGASGLMQIMPATGRELAGKLRALLSEGYLYDPATNIRLGTFYLRQLIDRFGGVEELAIAAYNGGQGNVRKWQQANRRPLDEFVESIPFSETRNYVKRVTMLRSTYAALAAEPRRTELASAPRVASEP